MRGKLFAVGLVALGAVAAHGVSLWMEERRRHEAFPAAKANDLLNPLRRIIQNPKRVVAAFDLRPGDTVLEVGPGPGYFTPHAADAVQPGGRVICFDLQRDMLLALRQHLRETETPAELVVGDAARLPFRNDGLDAVFLAEMLGEVPEPQAAVAEIERVLRPAGIASFCETMNDPDYVRLPVLRRMCEAAGLAPAGWRRELLGYVARFERAAEAERRAQ